MRVRSRRPNSRPNSCSTRLECLHTMQDAKLMDVRRGQPLNVSILKDLSSLSDSQVRRRLWRDILARTHPIRTDEILQKTCAKVLRQRQRLLLPV